MTLTPPKDTNQDLALFRHAFADLIAIRSLLEEMSEENATLGHPIDRIQTLVWTIGERLGEF